MKTVGLRELKNRLAEYVRQVRAGDSVLVTDRGEVVAELLPPGEATASQHPGIPAELLSLARKGQLTLGAPNRPGLYPDLSPALKQRRAADLLDEERGPR